MTALRTFGKLLLRRLPRDDTLNRELAKDIILQVRAQRVEQLARCSAHSTKNGEGGASTDVFKTFFQSVRVCVCTAD